MFCRYDLTILGMWLREILRKVEHVLMVLDGQMLTIAFICLFGVLQVTVGWCQPVITDWLGKILTLYQLIISSLLIYIPLIQVTKKENVRKYVDNRELL